MTYRRAPSATIAIATLAILMTLAPRLPAQLRLTPVGERPDRSSLDLLLRRLANTGTFIETDAHPDDEDSGLLAMLGYGQGMRVALVTATRGDGGQNEIGPELGQELSVLRTEELLAVHRFDGAEQYFTRAIDFGYSFSIDAPIDVLAPDDPVFTTPNTIGPETWADWVQERGTYFMGEKDARYVDLLRSADPFPYNAGPKTGILVETRVGKGRWMYTGLGLWRQLPAGVDGAYRLLANLISLGKS